MTLDAGRSDSEIQLPPLDGGVPAPARLPLILFALALSMFIGALFQTVFTTALPTIVGELHGAEHIAWVTTAYLVTATIVMPAYGTFGDSMGRRPLLLVALAVFVAGSVAGALSSSMGMLVAARAVQGLGGGGLMILAIAVIADLVPVRQRARFSGLFGAVFGLASVAGPLAGGWFTSVLGWRWVFWSIVPLGVLALLMVVYAIPESTPRLLPSRLDLRGLALIAVAVSSLAVLSSTAGSVYPWSSPLIVVLLAICVSSSIAVVLVERRRSFAVLPMDLFAERDFVVATVAGVIAAVAMFGMLVYLPTYLQMVEGFSPVRSGLMMVPLMAAMVVAAEGSGRAIARTGKYRWAPMSSAFLTAIGLAMIANWSMDETTVVLLGSLVILGIGLGLTVQVFTLIVQNTFPDARVGAATSSNRFFGEVGAVVGTSVVGAVFAHRLVVLLPAFSGMDVTPESLGGMSAAERLSVELAYHDALMPIFAVMIPVALVNVLLAAALTGRPLRSRRN